LLNTFADNIKNELQTLKPLLQKVLEDTKKLEEAIGKNSKNVEEFFKAVREEEIQMNAKNVESSQLAEDAKKAQEEFDKVVPALNAAIAGICYLSLRIHDFIGLRSLNKNDISELKVFLPNPPERIQKVLEAVCILRGFSACFIL
jgi:chromosome segregation ATPase